MTGLRPAPRGGSRLTRTPRGYRVTRENGATADVRWSRADQAGEATGSWTTAREATSAEVIIKEPGGCRRYALLTSAQVAKVLLEFEQAEDDPRICRACGEHGLAVYLLPDGRCEVCEGWTLVDDYSSGRV